MNPRPMLTITLPEPCSEDWHQMTPDGCGRFCGACQKTVIDFTVMTDAEIIAIFRNSETTPCGRFFAEQLNRPLQAPEISRPFPFYRKIAAAIIALQAFTIHSFAQGKKRPATVVHNKKLQRQEPRTITGKLIDYYEGPVPGAPLVITAGGFDTLYSTTDEQGCFLIILPEGYRPEKMDFSLAQAYAKTNGFFIDRTVAFNDETLHTEIVLQRLQPTVLPEAEVTTTPFYRNTYTGIAPYYREYKKPTTWQKITQPFRKHRRS